MKIKTEIEYDCPSGFYCNKGKSRCYRMYYENDKYAVCSVFNRYLDVDSNKNIIKCDDCVLAERSARAEM